MTIRKITNSPSSTKGAPRPGPPAAPPAYRPLPTPKVLQKKTAQIAVKEAPKPPHAPSIYRPQPTPRVLQRKETVSASGARALPIAPQPYQPNPSPKVLQRKVVAPAGIAARTCGPAPLTHKTVAPPVAQRAWAPSAHAQSPRRLHGAVIQRAGVTKGLKKSGEYKEPPKLSKKEQLELKKKELAAQKLEKRERREKARLGEKKEMTKEWETNKKFFDMYAKGAAPTPGGTQAPPKAIPVVDLADIRRDNHHLAALITDALDKIQARPGTPEHLNREGKLPIYAGVVSPYWEFSFLGGGGRIVVDAPGAMVYISMHYAYYYQLVDSGATPQHPVEAAQTQRDQMIEWERQAAALAAAEAVPVAAAVAALPEPAEEGGDGRGGGGGDGGGRGGPARGRGRGRGGRPGRGGGPGRGRGRGARVGGPPAKQATA